MRLAESEFLKNIHIKGALIRRNYEVIKTILGARPDIAESLPGYIVEVGGSSSAKRLGGNEILDLWNTLRCHFQESFEQSDILHRAVKERQVEIVKKLIKEYPEIATRQDNTNKIALYYNNEVSQILESGSTKSSIRDIIVPAIIRRNDPRTVQEILLDAGG